MAGKDLGAAEPSWSDDDDEAGTRQPETDVWQFNPPTAVDE